jgi:hypothetical protein
MKAFLFSLMLIVLCATIDARQGGNFGLGAVLGAPTGLSMKYWTGRNNAVSGALAFGGYAYHDHTWGGQELHLQGSYLWHSFGAIQVDRGQLPVYWGLGGRLLAGNDFALGVRGCGGFEYLFPKAPFDVFLELGLIIDFVGFVGADFDLGIGIRYFF